MLGALYTGYAQGRGQDHLWWGPKPSAVYSIGNAAESLHKHHCYCLLKSSWKLNSIENACTNQIQHVSHQGIHMQHRWWRTGSRLCPFHCLPTQHVNNMKNVPQNT